MQTHTHVYLMENITIVLQFARSIQTRNNRFSLCSNDYLWLLSISNTSIAFESVRSSASVFIVLGLIEHTWRRTMHLQLDSKRERNILLRFLFVSLCARAGSHRNCRSDHPFSLSVCKNAQIQKRKLNFFLLVLLLFCLYECRETAAE